MIYSNFTIGFTKQAIAGATYAKALLRRASKAGKASKVLPMVNALKQFGAQAGKGGQKARNLLTAGKKIKQVAKLAHMRPPRQAFQTLDFKRKLDKRKVDTPQEMRTMSTEAVKDPYNDADSGPGVGIPTT